MVSVLGHTLTCISFFSKSHYPYFETSSTILQMSFTPQSYFSFICPLHISLSSYITKNIVCLLSSSSSFPKICHTSFFYVLQTFSFLGYSCQLALLLRCPTHSHQSLPSNSTIPSSQSCSSNMKGTAEQKDKQMAQDIQLMMHGHFKGLLKRTTKRAAKIQRRCEGGHLIMQSVRKRLRAGVCSKIYSTT